MRMVIQYLKDAVSPFAFLLLQANGESGQYTIEGNSDNMVRQNSYPIGYGEIKGYGAVNP